MPRITTEKLSATLERSKPIPALLLLGDEPYLRDIWRTRIVDALIPEAARTWAVSRYSADQGETPSALEQTLTLPMLSSQQVVFLSDVEKIEKLGEKNRDATIDQLESYLQDPAPFTTLVLEAANLDQRMKLAKLLTEKTQVLEIALGDDLQARHAAAVQFAGTIAKEQKVTFESGAAEDLAEFVAADLMRLKTEIEKLTTYAGARKTITRADVSTMVISEKTTTVWDLSDLIASRDHKKALEFLNRLLRDGEEPLPMLGAITWLYRKLIEASELKGVSNGYQAARALGMRPEQAQLALRSARKLSRARLLPGLSALQRADDRLKRGEDARPILEFMITELTGISAASSSRSASSQSAVPVPLQPAAQKSG
jgi:DNA polymerase III subunit delta